MFFFILRIEVSPQSRGGELIPGIKLVNGLNYRLQYVFNSSNTYLQLSPATNSLQIYVPKGFFIAFPGENIFQTNDSTSSYKIDNFESFSMLNSEYYGFKQSNFEKSFYMTGGLESLEIKKHDKHAFETYIGVLEKSDCPYQTVVNISENKHIYVRADISKIQEQSIGKNKVYNFLIGYSKKYASSQYLISNFVPKGFQSVSQTSSTVNQKFIANFSRFLCTGLLETYVLQRFGQNNSILKTHKEVLNVIPETVLPETSDDEEDDDFLETYEEIEFDPTANIEDTRTQEITWFKTHHTKPTVYQSDNISYLLAKLPPISRFSKDTFSLYDLLKITLLVPDFILFLWGEEVIEYIPHNSTENIRYGRISLQIKRIQNTGVGIYPFHRENVMLSNPNIQFPMYILIESNLCHSNLVLGPNMAYPVLAILRKGSLNNGQLKTQCTYQLHYSPHSNQYISFRIVDREFNNVLLNKHSYFSLQITKAD